MSGLKKKPYIEYHILLLCFDSLVNGPVRDMMANGRRSGKTAACSADEAGLNIYKSNESLELWPGPRDVHVKVKNSRP